MNFQNVFEELNKLYEELPADKANKAADEPVEESCKKALAEEADEEDVVAEEETTPDDEIETSEEESEVRQLALKCKNCGAIIIKDESEVEIDDDGVANADVKCDFCEEIRGSDIVGVVTPYEAADEEIEIVDDADEESFEDEVTVEESLVEGISVKYGRGKPAVEFESLEDAIKHINDGMKNKAEDSYILYNDGKEMIWLDWYQASRDGSNNGYTVSRQDDKKTIKFEPNVGLSIIGDLEERLYDDEVGSGWNRNTPYSTQHTGRVFGGGNDEPPKWYLDQGGTRAGWANRAANNHEANKWEDRNRHYGT